MDRIVGNERPGFRELWNKSGEIWRNNRKKSAGAALTVAGTGIVLSIIPVIGILTALFVSPILKIGGFLFFFRLAKGESVSAQNIFDPFREYMRYLWATYRTGIFVFLWSLLLIVPGIIAALRYSQTLYLLQESPALSPKEAMQQSSDMMEGHKLSFFLYLLLFALIFSITMFLIITGGGLILGIAGAFVVSRLVIQLSTISVLLFLIWAILWICIRASLFFALFHMSISLRSGENNKEVTQ